MGCLPWVISRQYMSQRGYRRRRQEPSRRSVNTWKNSRARAPAIRARKLSFFPNSVHSFVLYRQEIFRRTLFFFFFFFFLTFYLFSSRPPPSFIDMKWRSFFFSLSPLSSSYTLGYSPIFFFFFFCVHRHLGVCCVWFLGSSTRFLFYFYFFLPKFSFHKIPFAAAAAPFFSLPPVLLWGFLVAVPRDGWRNVRADGENALCTSRTHVKQAGEQAFFPTPSASPSCSGPYASFVRVLHSDGNGTKYIAQSHFWFRRE